MILSREVARKNLMLQGRRKVSYFRSFQWRGGRAVEGARLEIVYTGNRIEGSNPSLSASLRCFAAAAGRPIRRSATSP